MLSSNLKNIKLTWILFNEKNQNKHYIEMVNNIFDIDRSIHFINYKEHK